MANTFHLDIVSAEGEIFSGLAQKLFIKGILGEMEILAGHAPLLTSLTPGPLWVIKENNDEAAFVVLGGILEVQPDVVIVLADSALRAQDCDEKAAKEAIDNVESRIANRQGELDYSKLHSELEIAAAQLRVIKKLKKKVN